MKIQPYKTIIVDDEPPARQRLKQLLHDFEQTFTIVGEAANGKEGIEKITRLQPDVIFLDIQMPGMTGFEMLQQLPEIPLVIFCTAYDEYSLQAFETNSIDYLLKPVRKERLARTVHKLDFLSKDIRARQIESFLKEVSEREKTEKKTTSLTVRQNKRLIFIKLEDIAYFKAGDKYVTLFHKKGGKHLTDLSLTKLEAQLPDHFLRIHRSIIINTSLIGEVQVYFNSRYSFTLNDQYNTRVTSGRSYLQQIKEWMDI